jgi:hypothetical protein
LIEAALLAARTLDSPQLCVYERLFAGRPDSPWKGSEQMTTLGLDSTVRVVEEASVEEPECESILNMSSM